MADPVTLDLFAEDRAHEELLRPLLERLAADLGHTALVRVRSARGGHARALGELKLYQKAILQGFAGATLPDLLVIAIDSNCKSYAETCREIRDTLDPAFLTLAVPACPDPHIERWYMADPDAFERVVGLRPQVGKQKCQRDVYKRLLAEAVLQAGHPSTFGGIEFARELAAALDYYRAGKADGAFKHFVEETAARLKTL